MPLAKARVSETSTTTGTGSFTLAGSRVGFQTFNVAFGTSISFYYSIEAVDGSNVPTGDWEYGIGHLSSATVLARDFVLQSSNSNALVNFFSGSKNVYCPGQTLATVGRVSGRLTLTSGAPVLSSTVSGATTIYFTPYCGNQIAITLDGSNFFFTGFAELSQATTDSAKSPAAVAANSVYDLFVWLDAGTLRCTRGPPWSSDTSRGTGAGTTELQLIGGYYSNKNSITNGPGAGLGTYVGSIRSNGSSTIDFGIGGAGSGGVAGNLAVWNCFNRLMRYASTEDTAAAYTYTTATLRQANSSAGNQVSFLSGLAEDSVAASYFFGVNLVTAANAGAFHYLNLDSTSVVNTPPVNYHVHQASAASNTWTFRGTMSTSAAPQLGYHFYAACEQGDGTNANTLNAAANNTLRFNMPM